MVGAVGGSWEVDGWFRIGWGLGGGEIGRGGGGRWEGQGNSGSQIMVGGGKIDREREAGELRRYLFVCGVFFLFVLDCLC